MLVITSSHLYIHDSALRVTVLNGKANAACVGVGSLKRWLLHMGQIFKGGTNTSVKPWLQTRSYCASDKSNYSCMRTSFLIVRISFRLALVQLSECQ